MTLTLEVDTDLVRSLEQGAAAMGETTSAYATRLLQQLSEEDRSRRIDELIAEIAQSSGSLGREGRPWREITHDGHKY